MPDIKVIGLGGCGINTLRRLRERKWSGIETTAIDTDVQSLAKADADRIMAVGREVLREDGAVDAAHAHLLGAFKEDLSDALRGADVVFLTGGLDGQTGSALMPVAAETAKQSAAAAVALVYKPFLLEGREHKRIAEQSLARLYAAADAVMAIEKMPPQA